MWQTLLGGFLETFLIITVGLRLIGVSTQSKWVSVVIISFYGSTILMMMKGITPSVMYLLITIIAIGILMTFIIDIGILASITALLLGCLTLLVSEVIGFVFLKDLHIFELLSSSRSSVLNAIPHLMVMMLLLILMSTIKFHIPIPVKKSKHSNQKIFSVLFLLFGFLFLFYSYVIKVNQIELVSISSAVFLVILTFSIFYMIRLQLLKSSETLAESLNEQYEEDLSKQIRIIRSQRHDFIHHLLATKQMLNAEKFQESVDYINAVLSESASTSDVLPISSDAIGGLLLSYKEKAASVGVEIHYQITDNLVSLPCKVYESNKIFGNLLANAIEAVKDLESNKRYIHLKIYKEKFYQIEISNFINEVAVIKSAQNFFMPGFSTKQGNKGHGLVILEDLVEKYDGSIHFEVTNDLITFYVKLPLGGTI